MKMSMKEIIKRVVKGNKYNSETFIASLRVWGGKK